MNTLEFNILIDAEPALVWDTMIAPETYTIWCGEFAEGTWFEGSWDQGASIRFLAPDGGGLNAVVEESVPHRSIRLRHLSMFKDGQELPLATEGGTPTYERYAFTPAGERTRLTVTMDCNPEDADYFRKVWPRALARLRSLCEDVA